MTALSTGSNVKVSADAANEEVAMPATVQENHERIEFRKLVLDAKKFSPGFRGTLEHRVARELPDAGHLNSFERLSFRERQLVLMRLHRLQSAVNLKPLPLAMGLFSAALGFNALLIRAVANDTTVVTWVLFGTSILLATLGVAMLFMIPRFTKTDAHLTAWTETFKDSHAKQTKVEEEKRKLAETKEVAPTAGGDAPIANPPVPELAAARS